MKKTLLWLDDVRNPNISMWLMEWAPEYAYDKENCQVVWVKNYQEFIDWITENGLPDEIGFDHDLSDEHYRPSMYAEDGHYSKYYTDGTFKEKTGYDAAKWLGEYCMSNKLLIPEFFVQSMNPIGRKNIHEYLKNVKKELKK